MNDKVIKGAVKFYKKNKANSLEIALDGNDITETGFTNLLTSLSFEWRPI